MENQRLGVLFSTKNNDYFYDSGTGKVFICDDYEYEIISKILSGSLKVKEACELSESINEMYHSQNILQSQIDKKLIIPTKKELEEILKNSCEQIIIELTEKCNLRCGYCVYNEHHPNFRGFGKKSIKLEIAKKAIDYILKNYTGKRFALSFYGGEPLLEFDIMKSCIEYAKENYPNIKMDVGFTTNLTLLDKDMIEYFKTLESVQILCSIDGPKYIHDKYRVYHDKKGSYEQVIKSFNMLLSEFYEEKNPDHNISINAVITPPYTKDTMENLEKFFYEELKLPKDIDCNFSYLDRGNMNLEINDSNEIISEELKKILEASPLEEWALDTFLSNVDDANRFRHLSQDILRISNRIISEKDVIKEVYLHGNCIPGKRRVYVTVDGDFKACERIGDSPALGNVYRGFDFDIIYKKYFTEYIEHFQKKCNNCWAQALCSLCYEHTMSSNGVKNDDLRNICNSSKRTIKDSLINYYRGLEIDSKKMKTYIEKYRNIYENEEGYKKYEI